MEFKWEQIFDCEEGLRCATYRSKCIGGWLVMNNTSAGQRLTQGLIFVPDPNHEWEIE